MSNRELRNVRKYSDVFEATTDPSPYLVLMGSVIGKRMRHSLQILLSYEGAGELKIPGSFIAAIPEITNLPINDVAELLDISKSTYYRVKTEPHLETETADKISSVLKIFYRGLEAFEGIKEDFQDWLKTRIPTLGNEKPLELLKTENGRSAVLDAIDRIEHNVYG